MGGTSSKSPQQSTSKAPETLNIVLKNLGSMKIKEGQLIQTQKKIQNAIAKHKSETKRMLAKMTNQNSKMNNQINQVTTKSNQLNIKIKSMKQKEKNNVQKEVQSKQLGRNVT